MKVYYDEEVDKEFVDPWDDGYTVCNLDDEFAELTHTYFDCSVCSNRTNYGTYIPVIDNYIPEMITFICRKCEIWYQGCVECSCKTNVVLLQIHFVDVCSDPEDDFEGRVRINKDLTTTTLYYWDEKLYGPITGPDGGFDSEWKCPSCSRIYEFCDK